MIKQFRMMDERKKSPHFWDKYLGLAIIGKIAFKLWRKFQPD